MFVWFVFGFIAAVLAIMIAEASKARFGLVEPDENVGKANALIGLAILILMVIAGPISFAVDIGLIIQYVINQHAASSKVEK